MNITWLGQAGLLFEVNGKTIIVDPYLSNSVAAIEPQNQRAVPVDPRFLELKPDILLLTHNHLDHTDPDTLQHYLTKDHEALVLASGNAYYNVRKLFGGKHNYVLFNRHTQWTAFGIRFQAVKAEHSDDCAIGILMEAEGKTYYITGDTLYNEDIFSDLPPHIDYVFLPINGRGNNMNMQDAKEFCQRIGAKAIPLHCGLFDCLDMNKFDYPNKTVPQFYQQIML